MVTTIVIDEEGNLMGHGVTDLHGAEHLLAAIPKVKGEQVFQVMGVMPSTYHTEFTMYKEAE